MTKKNLTDGSIRVRGAKQNNLKNVDIDFNHGELTVVTGVSGSGKSSLVFDTIYAEGQRRYVETFSPYVRQFMDRMDHPNVDSIEGVPPAIAIDQTNPVRTSRSTVGTMTEINDYLKMLFAQASNLYCSNCGEEVKEDSPQSIWSKLHRRFQKLSDSARIYVTFLSKVPKNFPLEKATATLEAQGFTHYSVLPAEKDGSHTIEVTADRFKKNVTRARAVEAIETALRLGRGSITVKVSDPETEKEFAWPFCSTLRCPTCNISYSHPHESTFSFNSAVGACEACKGFGRVIGIDYDLVIPDKSKTLAEGAVKPWTTESYKECQDELIEYCKKANVPTDVPFRDLSEKDQNFVLYGDPTWKSFHQRKWYGVKHFFEWLETKTYKMHVRVLLSRYRGYTICPSCNGSRLKPEALLWRVGSKEDAQKALASKDAQYKRFYPTGATFSQAILDNLPGLNIKDMMDLPIDRLLRFFETLELPSVYKKGCESVLEEIISRLRFLVDVGLGYLNLDRQSRTLSGGEVQRINLTTALGTSLVNTLFVLDEPSIGLHPQDMDRVNAVMKRLKEAGNTLIVVEHDPQVMLAADRVVDIGPGPGENGGKVVFDGTPSELQRSSTSTGKYLRGDKRIARPKRHKLHPLNPAIVLLGASEHNLKQLDVRIPLNAVVCVSGVSGSGKSTLIQDILVPALLKEKGKPTEAPGKFEQVLGADLIDDVVFVDQSAIGKTTRSNPAVFLGAFDAIRQQFANTVLAKQRNYKPGTFSFNSGTGRCPACEGSGYEHIEMQFLSDVYLSCPECKGTRYRQETLEVKVTRKGRSVNIAEVLDMTITEALDFFSDNKDVVASLTPLVKVGLGYLRLGQSVPTLSGGEAQRLKLARHLADALKGNSTKTLFVFDEPTTGLHFEDVSKLMDSFYELVKAGHSVLIIEHNLDVINASDWVIELGPYGGEKGGYELFAGTPKDFEIKDTPTGKALAAYNAAIKSKDPNKFALHQDIKFLGAPTKNRTDEITIVNARENNLKNLSLTIPRDKFTVVTGVSGSGKSTLAFDLVFNEGQRRYLESLNAYARSMVQPASKPSVDAIYGIPPTVAIEQRTSRGGQKSTVATMTEIYHFMRLLFTKLGVQFCPTCHIPVVPTSVESILADLIHLYKGKSITLVAPLVKNRKGIYKDLAAWAAAKSFDSLIVDGEVVSTRNFPTLARHSEHTILLPVSEFTVNVRKEAEIMRALSLALDYGHGVIEVHSEGKTKTYSTIHSCPECGTSFPELDPRLFSYNSKLGWCESCMGNGFTLFQDAIAKDNQISEMNEEALQTSTVCAVCDGKRLNKIALNVFFHGKSISDIASMTIEEAKEFFNNLKLEGREEKIAKDAIKEIVSRLSFLEEVGLSYLNLDRSAPTLSGGEAQRIRLASQLGTNLQGVCYVLDEPTIGLHPRDNGILLNALHKLTSKGNSLLVVEHDEDTIRKADHVIDIGPGAGVRGGRLIAEGTIEDIEACPESVTGRYLKHPLQHKGKAKRATTSKAPRIRLSGAKLNNVNVDSVDFPLNRLTVVTGVSGSGKSTLTREIFLPTLTQSIKEKQAVKTSICQDITGFEPVRRVLEVDQTPIGKTPRSCPATYIGFWDQIRKLFASTDEAKARGYTASRFSFNIKGGRCDACDGQGVQTVEMSFLPDVKVACDVCNTMRFNEETLEVKWKGKNIGEVLKMEVDEAVEFFASQPSIARPLQLMKDVGLGYLTLGQPSPTLSGGEAQRIKLVYELNKVRLDEAEPSKLNPHTVYILDEPTVGLHMSDVDKLIKVLHRLVDAGNTVIVIEHNLDVIAEADWIIDMGPEGGAQGGQVVFAGAPQKLTKLSTHTALALSEFLKNIQMHKTAKS